MENSQLKDLQEEVSEATKQYILTTFNSENGMKTYYLQMSNIIRSAHINPPIDTEYNSLKKLRKKLKQYCTFIQTLGEHEWDKGIADILGVSLRTVEAHMYKALKYLRGRLDPLWAILFLFLWRL